MPTQKQIDANRLNAEKSSGPRTPAGKAVSSMNALKSGVDARSHLIRGERRTDLETLTAGYYQRFHPATFEERLYVDTPLSATTGNSAVSPKSTLRFGNTRWIPLIG